MKRKTIFLDITCFFRGRWKDETIEILERYDAYARIRFHGLIEKSLVFISQYSTIEMHDLIQDMSRYVVKMQKDSGKPTRLWSVKDFEDVMVNNMQLPSLRRLNLSYSKNLKSTPDFTGMPNLEYLDLSICTREVHHSLGCPEKLIELNLSRCESLERFPYVNVESLEDLDIGYCSSLKKFPEFFGIMKSELEIEMQCSGIREIPSSFILPQWCHLTELDLSGMHNLVSLPSSICELKDLVKLHVSKCSKLESLPEGIGDLEKLEELYASFTLISRPPSSIVRLNKLKLLNFAKVQSEDRANFVVPWVNEGLRSLEELDLSFCNLIDGGLPGDIGSLSSLKKLNLRGNNFEHLPRSIVQLGALQSLDLTFCDKLKELSGFTGMTSLHTLDLSFCNLIDGGLPEDIGSLFSLKELDLSENNFEHLPPSIAQLGALQSLDLSFCHKLKEFPGFTGMTNLDTLNLNSCNLIDGGLPEDIGCLSSLKELNLQGNNFEHLPQSIAQLGALQTLNLSYCMRLKESPGFTGMTSLHTLDLSFCNLIGGGLPEDIGSLSSLKELDLSGNNFEHLPRSIAQLGALQSLDLSRCKRLKELPEFPQQLDRIDADWSNDLICNSLFQNMSSLQHDISASDSLSLRVFKSCWWDMNIPSWFHHRGTGRSVSVNLPENWYVSDNFLGFAVCYWQIK